MTDKLYDPVVLITGAGKGVGRRLAEALAGRGAIVAANDISPVNVEQVVNKINAQGGKSKAYIEDIAKKVAVQALVKNVEDDFGRIDVLINHAAVAPQVPLLEMDEWDWRRTLDVNLTGAFLLIQSVGRVMQAQGAGLIVNLLPLLNPVPLRPSPFGSGAGAYFASMAGLTELTRQAERELNPHGIRVRLVENLSPENAVNAVLRLMEE